MRKKILLLSLLLMFLSLPAMAQTMSDEEVLEYVKSATERGVSQKQIVIDLAAKGVTRAQAERIKAKYESDKKTLNSKSAVEKNRMRNSVELPSQMFEEDAERTGTRKESATPLTGTNKTSKTTTTTTKEGVEEEVTLTEDELFTEEERKKQYKTYTQFIDGDTIEIFGRSIFQNRDLTFAPLQNIATPDNYKLGPGDEVIIDIWGASQNSIREVISPDGYIVVQDLGLVYLSGKTIEVATSCLTEQFGKIYSGISDDAN